VLLLLTLACNHYTLLQVLWVHARMDVQPPPSLLAALLRSASQQLHRFSGRDAAMLLWALAALRQQPGQQLLQGLLQSLMLSSCKLDACAPQVGRLETDLAYLRGWWMVDSAAGHAAGCMATKGMHSAVLCCQVTVTNGGAGVWLVYGQMLRCDCGTTQ
jgi:hypothetical protein